jgi:23S rRNA (adenine2503-C2)-methyltransferase
MEKQNLKALSLPAISAFMSELGEKDFRARQLISWIYLKGATSFDEITVFSKDLRKKLSEVAYIGSLSIRDICVSDDGTEKFLIALEDGLSVECVVIPGDNRFTLCVSSQVGCAMGCGICKTGSMGMVRNLFAYEIVEQLLAVSAHIAPSRVSSIVFMGMGEPFNNLEEVQEAIMRITGILGISPKRITVSTCGIVPGIISLPKKTPDVNLAISLNATTDAVRRKLMPVNKKYPLDLLIDACRKYPLKKGRKITFEYVMLKGLNDSIGDAVRLIKLLKGIKAMVNLIPFNTFEGSRYEASDESTVLEFQEKLFSAGVQVFIRKSKGNGVMAACGQLWCKQEKIA